MDGKRIPALLLLSALLALPVHGIASTTKGTPGNGNGAELEGGDSPEDVFERAKLAAKNDDSRAFFRLIPPDTRLQIGFFMVTGTRMALNMKAQMEGGDASFEVARLDALLAKHGVRALPDNAAPVDLNDPEALTRAAKYSLEGVDVYDLIEDLQAFMGRLGFQGATSSVKPTGNINGGLTNLKIEGDRATATVDGKEGSFVKVNGRWYLMPEPAE
jgi:hypothetical protein